MKRRLLIVLLLTMLCVCAGVSRGKRNPRLNTADTFVALVNPSGHGSGVYLGNGVVLTAAHTAQNKGLVVLTESGHTFEILEKITPDSTEDIAFVLIDPNCGLIPVVLGGMPDVLDPVVTVGTPQQLLFINNVTTGVVSKMMVDWDRWDRGIMTSAPMQPGNSGGALLNSEFELIGITVGCHNRYPDCGDNLWLSEPIDDILMCLELSGLEV